MTDVTALAVPTLTTLASEINDAHRQVKFHAKGMLLEAKRAGEALLQAKKAVPRGGFDAWVKENTSLSRTQAYRYIQVASRLAGETIDPDATIDSVLDTHASRKVQPKADRPAFTATDAEYAQKLKAMADRGGTDNEREVAERKLKAFAEGFGMTAEEVVERAEKLNPEPEPLSPMDEAIDKSLEPFRKKSKEHLVQLLLYCMCEHPDLLQKLRDKL